MLETGGPGYLVTPRILDRVALAPVHEALTASLSTRSRAGARHVLSLAAVRALATSAPLIRLAASFVGPSPLPFRATLFDKSLRANWLVAWHQDTALPVRRRVGSPRWGPWSMKGGVLHAIAPASALATIIALRVHLDDSTATNGPLRVLPGTHGRGILRRDELEAAVTSIPAVECVCPAGGVVAMRPLLVHASSKAQDNRPRRVLHIEYTASAQMNGGVELIVG